MFIQTDYEALKVAVTIAVERGRDPSLQGMEHVEREGIRHGIHSSDIVRLFSRIHPREGHVLYLVFESGMMQGFYVVDTHHEGAWLWDGPMREASAGPIVTTFETMVREHLEQIKAAEKADLDRQGLSWSEHLRSLGTDEAGFEAEHRELAVRRVRQELGEDTPP